MRNITAQFNFVCADFVILFYKATWIFRSIYLAVRKRVCNFQCAYIRKHNKEASFVSFLNIVSQTAACACECACLISNRGLPNE